MVKEPTRFVDGKLELQITSTSETQPEPDPEPAAGGLSCEEALHAIALFLEGGLSAEAQDRLRTHLHGCPDCDEQYRGSVETLAQIAREKRLPAPAATRRRERRRGFLGAGTARGSRLRLLLLPAFFIFLIVQIGKLGEREPSARLTWTAGEVRVGERVLGPDFLSLGLVRGDWCWVRGRSEALLVAGETELLLLPDTRLMVENPETGSVRIETGGVELEGRGTVSSPAAVAEIEAGRARVRLVGGLLEVLCREGACRIVHPAGEFTLGPGELARAEAGGRVVVAALDAWGG